VTWTDHRDTRRLSQRARRRGRDCLGDEGLLGIRCREADSGLLLTPSRERRQAAPARTATMRESCTSRGKPARPFVSVLPPRACLRLARYQRNRSLALPTPPFWPRTARKLVIPRACDQHGWVRDPDANTKREKECAGVQRQSSYSGVGHHQRSSRAGCRCGAPSNPGNDLQAVPDRRDLAIRVQHTRGYCWTGSLAISRYGA
jgi:hypothetical protein